MSKWVSCDDDQVAKVFLNDIKYHLHYPPQSTYHIISLPSPSSQILVIETKSNLRDCLCNRFTSGSPNAVAGVKTPPRLCVHPSTEFRESRMVNALSDNILAVSPYPGSPPLTVAIPLNLLQFHKFQYKMSLCSTTQTNLHSLRVATSGDHCVRERTFCSLHN
jgi:hypothetical protein